MTIEIDDIPLPGMSALAAVEPPLPAGVTQQPEPCWHLLEAEGTPYLDVTDTVQHHPAEADARGQAQTVNEQHANDGEDLVALTTVQLPDPCWTATAVCGRELRDDEGAGVHEDTAESLLSRVADLEWTVRGGALRCWEHGDRCEAKR